MFDRLSREEIIKARREIEHGLKTVSDIPTRRYLEAKDKELFEMLDLTDQKELAA